MRDIKFRAWINNSKKFEAIEFIGAGQKTFPVYTKVNKYWFPMQGVLEQYTGLKDVNGVEIYEGDVVHYLGDERDFYEVKFGEFGVPNIESEEYVDNSVGFYLVVTGQLKNVAPFNMTIPLNKHYANSYKVIGNIHEQPELLEEK